MTAIANLPDLRPSLLLDFANSGRVDPRIQCTRASSATCWGPDGKLRTVAANVPRIDYDPATGKCLGLLVEYGATNTLLSSDDVSNTVWLKQGVANINEAVVISGVALRKLVGAVGQTSSYIQQSVASAGVGVAYTFSAIVMAAGALYVQLRILGAVSKITEATFNLATGVVESSANTRDAAIASLGGGMYRLSISFFTDQTGAVNVRASSLMAANGSVPSDGTSGTYLGCLQLELGDRPTSYIPTGASAVTRAGDLNRIHNLSLPKSYTLLVEYTNKDLEISDSSASFGYPLTLSESLGSVSASRAIAVQARNRAKEARAFYSGVGTVGLTQNITLDNTTTSGKVAVSVEGSGIVRASANGRPAITSSTPIDVFYSGYLSIGCSSDSVSNLNGNVKRVALYANAVGDSILRRLTA